MSSGSGQIYGRYGTLSALPSYGIPILMRRDAPLPPAKRGRMMKPLRIVTVLAVVAIATLSGTRDAMSEPGGLHLNITPFGGYANWAKDVNLDDKAMFGGRVGLGFGRYLGAEGYYSWL